MADLTEGGIIYQMGLSIRDAENHQGRWKKNSAPAMMRELGSGRNGSNKTGKAARPHHFLCDTGLWAILD